MDWRESLDFLNGRFKVQEEKSSENTGRLATTKENELGESLSSVPTVDDQVMLGFEESFQFEFQDDTLQVNLPVQEIHELSLKDCEESHDIVAPTTHRRRSYERSTESTNPSAVQLLAEDVGATSSIVNLQRLENAQDDSEETLSRVCSVLVSLLMLVNSRICKNVEDGSDIKGKVTMDVLNYLVRKNILPPHVFRTKELIKEHELEVLLHESYVTVMKKCSKPVKESSFFLKGESPSHVRQVKTPTAPVNRARFYRDFRNIKKIGSGGFGVVYKAQNTLDGVWYAVKQITVKRSAQEKLEEIVREVSVLAKLQHVNIVNYNSAWLEKDSNVDSFPSPADQASDDITSSHPSSSTGGNELDQGPRIVGHIQMELCSQNLTGYLENRVKNLEKAGVPRTDWITSVNRQEALAIFRDVVEAIAYIHDKDFIHRDLKPANVFLDENICVKVGDFGLAIEEEIDTRNEGSNHFNQAGTYLYSSPEQLDKGICSRKSDLFSLGLILYELLVPLYTSTEKREQFRMMRIPDFIPLDCISDLPSKVSLIKGLLAHDPKTRPDARTILDSENIFELKQ